VVVEKYFPTFWRGLRPGSLGAFAFAFICIELATIARLSLEKVGSASAMPYITYFPAILLATFVGGFWAGWGALTGTLILTWSWFDNPFDPSLAEVGTLSVFAATALVMVGAAERYREMLQRFKGEEHHRALLVAELEHRVKNKLTVVYAILSRELRDHPEVWQKVRGRLSTLTTADEFIARSNGAGAHLKSLIAMEFAPYGAARVRINSKDVFVPAMTATVLALMFHELVTNAAKYGALSVPEGRINVDWRVFRGEVTIDWVESGGPPVQTPQRKGFGTSLLERGLEDCCGRAALYYERSGLVCRLTFALPAKDAEQEEQTPSPVLHGGAVAA